MNSFYTFQNGFKWFVLSFLAIILAIIVPVKLQERNYLQIVLVLAIVAFIVIILFAISVYFNSMAVRFEADREYAYLTFSNGKKVIFLHSEVTKIENNPNNYVFFLSNGDKFYLAKNNFCATKAQLFELKSIYPNLLK